MSTKEFYSHGKLLITGEYLVMKGALALAVPSVYGQKMVVNETLRQGDKGKMGEILWKSFYDDTCWFEASFSLPGMKVISATNDKTAHYIQGLLQAAHDLNPGHLKKDISHTVESFLEFSPEWGLGSSSSLINNVASWFDINAYSLFGKLHKGSAYDIACAASDGPIWFRRSLGSPVVQRIDFSPPFRDKLLFVYSGQKQDSEASVQNFLREKDVASADKDRITAISRELPVVKEQGEFNALIDEHEAIMSRILGMPGIKGSLFSDFPGSIKSLGAWGGDFILASSTIDIEEIKAYFSKRGLDISFGWDEMLLSH